MSNTKISVGDNIFVYGTLRPGECRFGAIENDCVSVGQATLKGATIYDLGSFPAVRMDDSSSEVIGDVFTVASENVSGRLDAIEGHPTFYKREFLETSLGPAWVYLFQSDSPKKKIISGDWKKRNGEFS